MTKKYTFSTNGLEYSVNFSMIFGMAFVIIFLCYGILLQVHFSTDAYYTFFDMRPEGHLASGRFTVFFLVKWLSLFSINSVATQCIFTFLFILLLALSSTLLFDCLYAQTNHSLNSLLGMFLAIIVSFINIYYLELFLFSEMCCYWGLGTLLTIYAIRTTQSHRLLGWCIGYLFLLLGLGVYQAFIGLYIIWCTTYAVMEKKKNSASHFYVNYAKCLLIGGAASITSIMIPKVIQIFGGTVDTVRNASLSNIVDNAISIIKSQESVLIYGSYLYPKYLLIFIVVLILSILIGKMAIEKSGRTWLPIVFLVILTNYGIIFAPYLVAGIVWLSPRAIIPMGSFIASLLLLASQWREEKITILFIAVIQVFNIYQNQVISSDHLCTNKLDQEYALLLEAQIAEYEHQTGTEVKNIATRVDLAPQTKYTTLKHKAYNVNERAYINDWSDVTLLNYISGRSYNKINMPDEIYKKYFENKNWDVWCPEEQLVFDGDTLYWIKY